MNKREEEKLKKQQERLEKEIARTKAMSTFVFYNFTTPLTF